MTDELTPVIVNRILVVEDDREEAEFLKTFLEQNGFEVQLARDAGQAHAAFSMHIPDFVLLDLILPNEVSGFEVCERMKLERDHTPVLVLSAIELEDAKDLAERVGADAYVTKPYDPDELLKKIHATAELVWRRTHLEESDHRGQRVRFDCPTCGKRLKASASHRGHRLNCPHCGGSVTVPRHE